MGCSVCGRNACMASFHSLQEQNEAEMTPRQWRDKCAELKDETESLRSLIREMRGVLENVAENDDDEGRVPDEMILAAIQKSKEVCP